jgi:cytochrome c biogenesis protein CcmG/thiol:disulfide interchange protein DsbE
MNVKHGMRVVLLTLFASCATTNSPSPAPSAAVGKPLPELSLQDVANGQPFSVKSLAGQVVLLDIWASWCAPCKEELPLLDELAGRLHGSGISIVAVSIDEDRAAMNEFLSLKKSWQLRLAHDPQRLVPGELRPDKMPTSYVIDRRGILHAIHGGFNRGDIARIETELKELARP